MPFRMRQMARSGASANRSSDAIALSVPAETRVSLLFYSLSSWQVEARVTLWDAFVRDQCVNGNRVLGTVAED